MNGCPFHEKSTATIIPGEVHDVDCEECGTYRISGVAIELLEKRTELPLNWPCLVPAGHIINSRVVAQLDNA